MKITSTQNPKIKNLVKLKKARERKKQGLILVEGEDEIKLALKAGFKLKELYVNSELSSECPELSFEKIKPVKLSKEVFKRISYREHPENLLAVFEYKILNLDNIKLSKTPLLVVLEGIEKPGNLGAIMRTADTVGVDAVIVNDSRVDIYNPNVIRASRGAIFTTKLVVSEKEETIEYLRKNKIKSFATALQTKKSYTKIDFKKPSAIIFGTEADGLSKYWLKNSDELIKIPMKGSMDSLNVSVSAGIILFEIARQNSLTAK